MLRSFVRSVAPQVGLGGALLPRGLVLRRLGRIRRSYGVRLLGRWRNTARGSRLLYY